MNSLKMRFVPATEYYEQLLVRIPKAKKRIVIHAMVVLWQPPQTEKVLELLFDALERGVEVRLVGDMYSKFQANMPHFVRGTKSPKWGYTIGHNSNLQSKGAHITYVGKLGFNPYKQRCHSKATIIDDVVYTFGGVNFSEDSFTFHDYMIECESTAFAGRVYSLVRDIEKFPRIADVAEKIDAHNTLLFDGGTPGSSVIYDAACDAIANAKKVYYVSQMSPSGRLAKLISQVDNECYFTRPSQADPPTSLSILVDSTRFGITNRYKGKIYIHAKFILCEGKDGSKWVISGSNNFSWRGIAYGTKEIALLSSDEKMWQTFYDYLQKEIIHES